MRWWIFARSCAMGTETFHSSVAGRLRLAQAIAPLRLSIAVAAALTAFACVSASAVGIEVTADVDRRSLGVGQELVLSVTVSGGLQNLPTPELPALPDFSVYTSGSSTNFSFVNGRVTSSKTSRFVLVPKQEGTLTIPPITVDLKGHEYRTDPIQISVSAAPQPEPTVQETPAEARGGGLMLKASLDKDRAYVNEQVTLTLRFFRRSALISSRVIPPETTGFWVEELPGEKDYYDVVDGLQYYVTEISRALFPTTEGVLRIGPATWKCAVREHVDPFSRDPFGILGGDLARARSATVRSEELELEVSPLPEQGRPSDFTGAVGRFRVKAAVDNATVEAEEPLTLTVTVSGKGNINAVGDLEMPELPGFRSYDSGGSVDLSKDQGIVRGSKSFSRVFIPSVPGEYLIPPVRVAYFDPEEGRYTIASSEGIAVTVTPAAGVPVVGRGGTIGGDLAAKDIRYIKTDVPSFSLVGERLYRRTYFLLLQLLPPAMVVGVYAYRTAKERAGRDPSRARSRRARREAMRRLAAARSLAREGRRDEAWKAVSGALTTYLSDILNVSAPGLTMNEVRSGLGALGIEEGVVNEAVAAIECCDLAAFAPREHSMAGSDEMARSATGIIKRLEKVRRK